MSKMSNKKTYTPGRVLESIKDLISGDDLAAIGFYEVEPMFAAAPELLEAAKFVEREIQKWREGGRPDYGYFMDCQDKLQAAIAKAEGR